ncbi:MAG: GyrI-like domain-containing protein [Devosia sp.]
MLTLPKLVDRPAQSYLAITRAVTIPFGDVIGGIMGELFGGLNAAGIQPVGPVFFKYDIVNMPELVITFGVPVAAGTAAVGPLDAGTLPAGRYAQTTYWGHYDNLMDVNAILIGWARERGLVWDATTEADGDHFVSRIEIYPNGPDDEPDPEKWETTVAIKVRG